jgi:fluoroacetyl-CoA thioesterase
MYVVTAEFDALQPGLDARTERVIDDELLTRHVGGSGLFSTPSMIMLMEQTAQAAVEPLLPDGNTTVGYEVCVRHLAPASAGEAIVVTARLTEVTGSRLLYQVECSKDAGDTLVGTGTHRRAIIPRLA